MHHNKKAFTLVEMLVALAVSSIIIAATFASFELIQKQYKKNIDVAELHTSGRAIMSILEREIRMAGYEFRDGNGLMTYGSITEPIEIIDSGNKCCDEVTIIYDEVFDTLNASGVVTSSIVERVKTRFWTEPYTSSKHGARNRLFKRRTILGTNNALLATPRAGAKEVMADYIEDLQISDATISSKCDSLKVCQLYNGLKVHAEKVKLDQENRLKQDPSSTLMSRRYVQILNWKGNVEVQVLGRSRNGKSCQDSGNWVSMNWPPPNNSSSRLKISDYDAASCTSDSSCYTKPEGWISKQNPMCLFGDGSSNGNGFKLSPSACNSESFYISASPVLSIKSSTNGTAYSDFQCSSGFPYQINIDLTIRTKSEYGKNRLVNKKNYHPGNFNFSKNDKYQRDTFSTTVIARNL
jgi:prepilin-type N-terminal cleavage/methylation domain-containing protein